MNFFNKLTTADNLNGYNEANLKQVVNTINSVVTVILGLLLTGVIILTIMIAYKFFTASTEDKRKNAKAQLIYAIIGIIALIALLAFAPAIVNAITAAVKGDSTTAGGMFNLF